MKTLAMPVIPYHDTESIALSFRTTPPPSFRATTRNPVLKLISNLLVVFGLVMMFAVSGWGAISITSSTLNGANSVSVAPSATIAANVALTSTFGTNWQSTSWNINGGTFTCIDHTNYNNSGNYNENFNITALAAAGTYTVIFRAHTNNICTSGTVTRTMTNAVTVVPPSVPEINIQGNSNNIVNGATSPVLSNNTDFGTTVIGTPVDKTYTIQNTGTGVLNLTGTPHVTISGTDASAFSVTAQPSTPVGSGTGTTNFTVRFNPTASGVRTATVSIANDDSNENPYTFAIKGKVNTPPVANDNSFTAATGVAFSGNVKTDDSDPDGDTFTVTSHTALSNPAAGSLTGPVSNGSFTFTANPGFEGTSVYFDYNITDSDFAMDTARLTLNIVKPQADLAISKSGDTLVNAGESMFYRLDVSSLTSSSVEAQNVVVTDTLPSGFTYNGVTSPDGVDVPGGWSCTLGTALTCTKATLGIGTSSSIFINGFAPSVGGDINNSAEVSSDTTDLDSSNNISNVVTTTVVAVSADLSITKTASPAGTVNTASPLTYTISVRNNGSGAAKNVQVIDSLNSNLFFVSVNGGTDWSCSQGQLVLCDYIGTGGILASGDTAGDITLKVTTPAVPQSIPNEASVSSSTSDPALGNNKSTVTVDVVDGQTTAGEVPMFKYLQYNVFGDMKLIGNANVNYSGTDPNQNYNDNVDMQYVDTDGDNSTFNSSNSTLSIDPSYTIVWAGLYWAGDLCESNNDDTCEYSNKTGYKTYDQSKNHLGDVLLKTPDRSGYITVNANQVYLTQNSDDTWTSYGSFADITQYVGEHEIGTYSVANMALNNGYSVQGGTYGGWAILFIYKDDTNTLHYKNISVFNGFDYVNDVDHPTQIPIDGFVTPLSGPVNGSVAFFGVDGDPVLGGYMQMRQGNGTTYGTVSNTANPADNVLNSTITEFGTNINTGITKTYGVDADRLDISSFLDNGQHDTNFKFGAGTSSNMDYYSLNMFAFATDLTTPIIDNFDKTASIVDSNGTLRAAGPGVEIYPGSKIIYTLHFENTGDEIAELVEIFDDFDFDGLTSGLQLSNFDASSIKLSQANSTTWQTNPNCGYDSSAHKVWCKIPQVAVGDEYTMQFAVRVASNLSGVEDTNATNTAYTSYKNASTDEFVVLQSNQYGNFGGKSNTNNAGTFTTPAGYTPPSVLGAFDVVHTTYYNNGLGKNIPTQIASRVDNFKVLAYETGSQTLKDVNTTVSLQLVEANTKAECEGMNYQPLNNRAWVLFNNNSSTDFNGDVIAANYGFINASVTSKDEEFYQKAAKNTWFKITYNAASADGDLVQTSVIQSGAHAGNIAINNFTDLAQGLEGYNDDLPPSDRNKCVVPVVRGNQTYNTMPQACGNNAQTNGVSFEQLSICMECVYGVNTRTFCSTDNFAIRPDTYTNPPTVSPSGTLVAGQDFNLTVIAKGYNNAILTGYDGNATVSPLTQLAACEIDDGNLTNTANVSASPILFNGVDTNVSNNMKFGDIGVFDINITDSTWSTVDSSKTPAECIIGSNTNVAVNGAVGCDVSITFTTTVIPDHFDVNGTLSNGSTGFTYLHNNDSNATLDQNISAILNSNVTAKSAQDGITRNYAGDCYAKDGNSTLTLSFNPAITPANSLNNGLWYDDINNSNTGSFTIATTPTLDHPKDRFASGIGNLRYRLNFDRNVIQTVNPFMMSIPDMTVIDDDNVDGNDAIDNNATFVYGRIIPRDVRVFGAVPFSANAWYEVYNAPTINSIGLPPSRNSAQWYINSLHADMSDGDGNVTVISSAGVNTGVNLGGVAVSGVETYSFSAQTPPYSAKAHINTDPWLWYGVSVSPYADPSLGSPSNLDCLTHPCFNISVVPAVGRAGSSTSDDLKSDKANKSTSTPSGIIYDYSPALQ